MPLTESVSCIIEVSEARLCCVALLVERRTLPSRKVMKMKSGSRHSEMSVNNGLIMSIAIIVLMKVETFETMLVAVSVTTD